jgi:hypothetical protein
LLNNEVTIPNTNSQLHYKLVRIVNGDPAVGSFPDPNLSEQDAAGDANTSFRVTLGNGATPVTPGVSGRITLDVTGRAVDAGGKESLYHLRKTFAVIPKCCGSSFGGFRSSGASTLWGNDERTDCGVASGYGLILGSRRDLTNADTKGSFAAGFAIRLERIFGGSATSSTVSRVYCTVNKRTPEPTDCPISGAGSGTTLRLKDIALPALPFPSNTGTYTFTGDQPTLSEFTATRPTGGITRPITNAVRSGSNVTLTICTTTACGGSHSFAVGQQVVVADLPSPFTSINNTTTSQDYTIDRVTSTTIRFPQTGGSIPGRAVAAGYAANAVVAPVPRWFWDTAPTGSCTTGTSCGVPGYSRMRVCDAAVSDGTTTPPWLGGSHRSISNATLSSSAPVPGCNITVSRDETLNTREFATWKDSPGDTLKWHLGRLCRSVTWPPTGGVTTIYCSLDQLTLNGANITFNTAGASANSSIPIILSFPNGNSTLRPITHAVRSGSNVTLTICTTTACGGSHSFAVGQTVVVGDLPSPFTSINNTPTSRSYTITAANSSTIQFSQSGTSTSIPSAAVLAGYAANAAPAISASQNIINSTFRLGLSSSIRQTNTQRSGNPRLTDLSIYGCPSPTEIFTPCKFQGISTGIILASLRLSDVFVYAPNASMSAVVSSVTFRGAYWGNKLSQLIPGSSFTIPGGSIDQIVTSFPSFTPAALDLEQDYVARQVIRVGTFDPN